MSYSNPLLKPDFGVASWDRRYFDESLGRQARPYERTGEGHPSGVPGKAFAPWERPANIMEIFERDRQLIEAEPGVLESPRA